MHLYRSRLDFYKPWLMKADEKADWYRLSLEDASLQVKLNLVKNSLKNLGDLLNSDIRV
jgi:hypothetical protein